MMQEREGIQLEAPRLALGTKMEFQGFQGFLNPDDRKALIEHLKANGTRLRGSFGNFLEIKNGLKARPHKAQAFRPGENSRKKKRPERSQANIDPMPSFI